MDQLAAAKTRLKQLMVQRDSIEREIAERSARLNAPGQPGMQGSLLAKQGFPRADIDVAAVRADRSRIICLTNDHKALMKTIDLALQDLHTAARNDNSASATAPEPKKPKTALTSSMPSTPPPQPMELDAAATSMPPPQDQHPTPFAVIDELSEASPASTAGIQLGDQMCKFGDVTWAGTGQAASVLPAVAAALHANKGRPVEAVLLRQGQIVRLQLVPREWAGRGLLGCHLRPL